MSDFDLNALIRDALDRWKEPDPHVIARRLLAKIPSEERDAIVLHGLTERVSLAARMERQGTGVAPRVGRSRWQRYSQRVCVADGWKLLGDCTADECEWLATDRETSAVKLLAVADQFRALAARMRSEGAATVADLPDVDVQDLAA